jgi:hypothetical protein
MSGTESGRRTDVMRMHSRNTKELAIYLVDYVISLFFRRIVAHGAQERGHVLRSDAT